MVEGNVLAASLDVVAIRLQVGANVQIIDPELPGGGRGKCHVTWRPG